MTSREWTALLSRSALAGLAAISLVACGPREPTTDAERLARGRELVQQMSARLAQATDISVTTTEVRDVVRPSGRKEPVAITGAYTVRRPDRFSASMTGGRGLEAWYNGKMLTIAIPADKVFAQAPMPETIDRTLDALAERYDMALPMGDLFYGSAEKALLSDTTTGGYAGTENVGGTPCHHLAFQDVGVDWELWLPVQGEPLPKRFKVVQKQRTGQPVVDVTFTELELSRRRPTGDATFVPNVPAGLRGHRHRAARRGGQEHGSIALRRRGGPGEEVTSPRGRSESQSSNQKGTPVHELTAHGNETHRELPGRRTRRLDRPDADVGASARQPARRRRQRRQRGRGRRPARRGRQGRRRLRRGRTAWRRRQRRGGLCRGRPARQRRDRRRDRRQRRPPSAAAARSSSAKKARPRSGRYGNVVVADRYESYDAWKSRGRGRRRHRHRHDAGEAAGRRDDRRRDRIDLLLPRQRLLHARDEQRNGRVPGHRASRRARSSRRSRRPARACASATSPTRSVARRITRACRRDIRWSC